ncbi:CPBP family intramembrane glutamic endopeptidase [Microbacterium marinilacus]|uniref:CAAX prenyl protease 2/Lysostaphin resistance protein A-like domain-containing protein n=1 Tax=Microbacterium marinilacus TaxID=415209 RepID=A0ABP7B4N9_9MICO|nr:type II CAAX endopeptidase family protein [Microbacterium marinilacus]MBY0687965.1 CPBP family intramembrane metalloprotease [Microbacterium marinilacus]
MDISAPAVRGATMPDPGPEPRLGVGPLGISIRLVVAVVVLMAANLVAGSVPALAMLVPGAVEALSGSSPWGFALSFAMQALVLAIVLVAVRSWMRWVERTPLREAGWRWAPRSALWALLGVVVSAASVLGVTAVLPATGPVLDERSLTGDQATTSTTVVLLVVYYLGLAFLQQGIPEELLFRGWLLWRLRDRPVIAVTVTTLAFTVIHLVSQGGQQSPAEHLIYLALPFGFALLATGLLLWTTSLWAAVGVHGGFHVGNYLAAVYLPQVDAVTSWLVVGGAQAALGLLLVVTALRRGRRILDGSS